MKSAAVALIRTPTDEELNGLRNLWAALGQQKLPSSVNLSDELQAYLRHAARMVGLIAGVNTKTGEAHWQNESSISVSTDGVARLRDSALLWARILALWLSTTQAEEQKQSSQ